MKFDITAKIALTSHDWNHSELPHPTMELNHVQNHHESMEGVQGPCSLDEMVVVISYILIALE